MSRQLQGHVWLREHKDMLRTLWNDDHLSCSEIADVINETFNLQRSKSSIIGRAHRMGLPKKKSPILKQEIPFDRLTFIRMYQSNEPSTKIMDKFGLYTNEQVRYRANKLGLKPRKGSRSRPERIDHRKREHIHAMLPADDVGVPIQAYERINNGSRKWFMDRPGCMAQPCQYQSVPGTVVCYEHGGMM